MFTFSLVAHCADCNLPFSTTYTVGGDPLCSVCPSCEEAISDFIQFCEEQAFMDEMRGI